MIRNYFFLRRRVSHGVGGRKKAVAGALWPPVRSRPAWPVDAPVGGRARALRRVVSLEAPSGRAVAVGKLLAALAETYVGVSANPALALSTLEWIVE